MIGMGLSHDYDLRDRLVAVALEWERSFGVAPLITNALGELDAAMLVGCPLDSYQAFMRTRTAVSRGHDFEFVGYRYQVKSNRPSGKRGSPVTLVSKANNLNWDYLVWILYSPSYEIQEAWLWDVTSYAQQLDQVEHVRPKHMRGGTQLYPLPDGAGGVVQPTPHELSATSLSRSVDDPEACAAADRGSAFEILLDASVSHLAEWTPSTAAGVKYSEWNGDDDNGNFTHRGVVDSRREPLYLSLSWRRRDLPAVFVGHFRLSQSNLLASGFIREETTRPGMNRLRIAHINGDILAIQVSSDSPALHLARFRESRK